MAPGPALQPFDSRHVRPLRSGMVRTPARPRAGAMFAELSFCASSLGGGRVGRARRARVPGARSRCGVARSSPTPPRGTPGTPRPCARRAPLRARRPGEPSEASCGLPSTPMQAGGGRTGPVSTLCRICDSRERVASRVVGTANRTDCGATILAPARLDVDFLLVVGVLLAWQAVLHPPRGHHRPGARERPRAARRREGAAARRRGDWFIDAARDGRAHDLLTFAYQHIHLPMLLGFLAAARLAAPARYPARPSGAVRLLHPGRCPDRADPAGAAPLAPRARQPGTTDGRRADRPRPPSSWQNSTAAIASQHFGYAFLIAAASLWLWPRSPIARALTLYPVLVFVVVVGDRQPLRPGLRHRRVHDHVRRRGRSGGLRRAFRGPELQPAPALATLALVGVALALGVAGLITTSITAVAVFTTTAVVRAVGDHPETLEAADSA